MITRSKAGKARDHARGYTDADLDDVSDNPEWTPAMRESARPFAAVFPDLAASMRRTRGPQKAPTKQPVNLRLDQDVIDHFKAGGPGWQVRMGAALRTAAGLDTRNDT